MALPDASTVGVQFGSPHLRTGKGRENGASQRIRVGTSSLRGRLFSVEKRQLRGVMEDINKIMDCVKEARIARPFFLFHKARSRSPPVKLFTG